MSVACAMFAGGSVVCLFKEPLGNLVGFLGLPVGLARGLVCFVY